MTFYDPVPDEMIPDDDLDLQVVWLQRICEAGLSITNTLLAQGWLDNIHMWPDEYGVCRVPAIHRPGPTGVDLDLDLPGGGNRLTIAVSNPGDGQFFHAIGDGPTWGWRRFVEYGNPFSHGYSDDSQAV